MSCNTLIWFTEVFTMIKRALGLTILGSLLACAAIAGPPAPKTVALHTCPMTGEAIKGAGVDAETVGKYKISFCCAGCRPQFDALSKSAKDKKLAEIAKKEAAAKKGTPAK